MTSKPLQSRSSVWKKLMDSGLFDDSYSLRVSASFNFLASDANGLSFTLKDIINKGNIILIYLSLDVDKDSNFAVMDLFRIFDRSGKGHVVIEDFALGVIEKLHQLRDDLSTLEAIGERLLAAESRCTELATLIEKGSSSEHFAKFNLHLKAFALPIRAQIRLIKARDNLSALDLASLVGIFRHVLTQSAVDVQSYFHIPSSRTSNMLIGMLTASNTVLTAGRMLWQVSEKGYRDDTTENEAEQVLGQLISSHHDDKHSSPRHRTTSEQIINTRRTHGVSHGMLNAARPQDLLHLLHDLKEVAPLLDGQQLLAQPIAPDTAQLQLLQDALLSMSSFFTIRSFADDSDDAQHDYEGDEGEGLRTYSNTTNHSTNHNNGSKDKLKGTKEHIPGQAEVLARLKEYKEALYSTNSPITPTTTPEADPGNAITNSNNLLEAVLTERLMATQETLTRTTARLQILELIQSQLSHADIDGRYNGNSQAGDDDGDNGSQSTEGMLAKHLSSATTAPTGNARSSAYYPTKDPATTTQQHRTGGFFPQEEAQENVPQHVIAFDRIMQELSLLGAALADRSSADYPFGSLLRQDQQDGSNNSSRCLLVMDPATSPAMTASVLRSVGNVAPVTPSGRRHSGSNNNGNNNGNGSNNSNANSPIPPPTTDNNNGSSSAPYHKDNPIKLTLLTMDNATRDVSDELRRRQDQALIREGNTHDLKLKELSLSELRADNEQAEHERSEYIALAVEMQVLREKAMKMARDDHQFKMLEARNADLVRKVRDLEEQLQQAVTNSNNTHNSSNIDANSVFVSSSSKNNTVTGPVPSSTHSNSAQSSSTGGMNVNDIIRLKEQLASITKKHDHREKELDQHLKENQRLKAAVKVSEQRLKSALQDQMTLHHQVQALEEEVVHTKTTVTKLTRELEEQRALRAFKEDAERRIFELQKEVNKRDVEFSEAVESKGLANKYHSDLIHAERTIESLEQRLAEASVELEKGSVAINQLENYRDQLRTKTKELRDMSLHIHGLEAQIKDAVYLQTRIGELTEELQEAKLKGEKIPGLLAELSRLRGGARASIKALAEQDKLLNHLKIRVKQLEKENALLKNDNRALQDVEVKLKDAHNEVKRLMTMVAEVNALKAGARNAEEEKKSMEGHYRKMRKFMHQSVLMQNNNGGGGDDMET